MKLLHDRKHLRAVFSEVVEHFPAFDIEIFADGVDLIQRRIRFFGQNLLDEAIGCANARTEIAHRSIFVIVKHIG